MRYIDLHTHTTFCDGKNTPEEMVEAALERKMECIGFSAHSYTFFDESYCIKRERIDEYKNEIQRLRNKYKDKIKVLLGIEQDVYSDIEPEGYDYIIGSAHYIKTKEGYFGIDESPEDFIRIRDTYFNKDVYLLAEEYFKTVSLIKRADIIGHIDLCAKFNEGERFFSQNDERYIKSYREAVKKLIGVCSVFEINTGAVSRGYKTEPYPSEGILRYIKDNGGQFILSGDAHSADGLMHGFEKYSSLCTDETYNLII